MNPNHSASAPPRLCGEKRAPFIHDDFLDNSPEEMAAWLLWLSRAKKYGPKYPHGFHHQFTCSQTEYCLKRGLLRPDAQGTRPIGKHTFEMEEPAELNGRCIQCGTHKDEHGPRPVPRKPGSGLYEHARSKPTPYALYCGGAHPRHEYNALGLCSRCNHQRKRSRPTKSPQS